MVIDKVNTRLYAFDASGKPLAATPVLIGMGIGDSFASGVSQMDMYQTKPWQRVTPAGRFQADVFEKGHCIPPLSHATVSVYVCRKRTRSRPCSIYESAKVDRSIPAIEHTGRRSEHDLADVENLAYLLRFDTVPRALPAHQMLRAALGLTSGG